MPEGEEGAAAASGSATLEQSFILIGTYSIFFLSKLIWSYLERLKH